MKDDYLYLETILECIERIERFTDKGETSFFKDDKTQDAVIRNFQVIGDAIKDLSPKFRKAHSEINWSDATKFRDKLTHGYLGVDLDRVWDFKNCEMRELAKKITEIIKKRESGK